MNFYVTLPSNGADLLTEDDRKNNTQTDFTIKLNRPLEFNVPYEVALAEIWYSINWNVTVTNLKIFFEDELLINSRVEFRDGSNLAQLFKKIKNTIQIEIEKMRFDKITEKIRQNPKQSEKLDNLIDSVLAEEHGIDSMTEHKSILRLLLKKIKFDDEISKNQNTLLNIFVPNSLRLEMTGYLPSLLTQWLSIKPDMIKEVEDSQFDERKNNIKNTQDFLSIKGDNNIEFQFLLSMDQLRVLDELYLYTDIIDYQYVGSQMRKLLRIITVNKNFDTVSHTSFSDLHYLPVSTTRLDSIQLKLADDLGQPIRFGDERSRVIYTLHFRPINKTTY